ncbi:MAG: hypothetical protein GXO19_06325 [Epsilonproteobacteria bacterium]|nr:hypothetical protein [Campylobacterota bacterium]NPA57332.1 hypothetical protein [Campylobacterota bacterium]
MQTFSCLRRSGDDAHTLKRIGALALLLFIYEPLTTIYIFLPPLLGLLAWRSLCPKPWERTVTILYFYIYEIDHSLPFMTLLATLLLYHLAVRQLFRYLACRLCIMGLSVALFYLILMGVMLFYRQIFSIDLPIDPNFFLLYTILDLVILYAL